MKQFWKVALLAPLLALVPALASAQSGFFFPQTPQAPVNCIYSATPLPYPTPTGPTAMTLHCDINGNLLTSGGGGGGGNVVITGPLGTNTKAASVSITIASDQGSIPVTATLALPFTGGASGVATAAGQSVGIVAYNGTTMDALKSTTGALNVNISSQTGLSPLVVTTPAPAATGAHGGTVVEGVASGVAVPVSGTVTVTPPLTGISGTGTAAAVGQAIVSSCNFTTAFPTLSTGNVGPNQCNASGAQYMDLGFSGNVALGATANYGTSPGAVKALSANAFVTNAVAVTGPITGVSGGGAVAGAAGQTIVSGCVFTTAFPTISTTDVAPVQCNASGAQDMDITHSGGVALGAMANYGTSPGAVKVLGVNADVTNVVAITPPLTGANSTGTASAAAQAVVADCNFTTSPATVTSGDVVPHSCDNLARQIVVGGGTLGTPSGGVMTVQGGAAMTPVQAGIAAVTGHGFTHLGSTAITAGTAGTICAGACTLAGVYVSWAPTSSAGVCYLTIYNATAPTVGTSFVGIYPINTAAAGSFAVPIPGTIGQAMSTAATYAVTTTPTGSTACNTTASTLFIEGWSI